MKHKHHIKRLLHPAAAVLFTAFIITVALIRSHIYPFGENLLVYNDMQYQYTDFFLWFSNVLHGKDSLIYSFHSGLGGSTLALFAYYLASPLNLLVYFVDSAHIGEFLTLLICLKLILCSVTSYIYISRRFQPAPLFRILISVSYALMGYNILQCSTCHCTWNLPADFREQTKPLFFHPFLWNSYLLVHRIYALSFCGSVFFI